jgi:hypothetical protein
MNHQFEKYKMYFESKLNITKGNLRLMHIFFINLKGYSFLILCFMNNFLNYGNQRIINFC